MASRVILKRGNDQIVTLSGLRTTDTHEYLNEATVKATLQDQKGVPLPAFSGIPMVYVPDSAGNYEWVIESDQMMLPKGVEYSLVVTAEQEGMNYRVVYPVSVIEGEC